MRDIANPVDLLDLSAWTDSPMPIEDELQDRRNDYDVTNTVQVSSAPLVRAAVADLFGALYPQSSFDSVWLAFHDFERVFRGLDPSYHAVDTTYHDMQHTLDMTLALARLIAGHEMSVEPGDRLGADRAELAIASATPAPSTAPCSRACTSPAAASIWSATCRASG